jgi:hypothetical protein
MTISSKYTVLLAMFAANALGCGGLYETNMVAAPVTPAAVVEAPIGSSDAVVIGANTTVYEDTDPSALADFREPLSPYGVWVDDGAYGTVWVPHSHVVGADFQPYVSGGHWTYDNDYVWVSDYAWGWAPFHYGRWVYITGRGWAWIPGRTYSGAWVTWRTGPSGYGYVGWAPMPPNWYWYNGYAVGLGVVPPAPYVFCHTDYVFHSDVHGRVVRDPAQIQHIGGSTRPYVPASPTVNDRIAATPTVNGRVAASPNVAGGSTLSERGYVAAGPHPSSLGIANAPAVPHENAGLTQARSFAAPTTPSTYANPRADADARGVATATRFQGIEPRQVPREQRPSSTVAQQPSTWTRQTEQPRLVPPPPREVAVQPGVQPPVFSRPNLEPARPASRPQVVEAARPSTPSYSRPSAPSVGGASQSFSRPAAPSVSPAPALRSGGFRRR